MLTAAPLPSSEAETIGVPRILVFDSGLGGLTVFAEIVRSRPDAYYLYAADDAVFPYGELAEVDLVRRVVSVLGQLIASHRPDVVVIACNTASTAVLPPLRAQWPAIDFVGTVPAIKPAAAASLTKRISVLATAGTVRRDYTRDLVRSFAEGCDVDLVGAPRLAALAEAAMRGEGVADREVAVEIAPAFVDRDGRKTDTVVLACTHYPLLLPWFERLSPWPVAFVDSASAIARRVDAVLVRRGLVRQGEGMPRSRDALFTSGAAAGPALARALAQMGLVTLHQQ